MNPNLLSDREKALENQWIREKEKQMAKDNAAKKQQAANKDTNKDTESGSKAQQQTGEEQK